MQTSLSWRVLTETIFVFVFFSTLKKPGAKEKSLWDLQKGDNSLDWLLQKHFEN